MRQFVLGIIAIITTSFSPFFAQNSVTNASLSPKQSPVVTPTRSTAGVTDLWNEAQKLYQKKEYKKALTLSLEVFDHANKAQNKHLIRSSSNLIAEIFKISNNYEKALEYYKIESNYIDKNSSDEITLNLYKNFSKIYFELEQLDSSEIYINKTLYYTKTENKYEKFKAIAYTNLSTIRIQQNKLEEAEKFVNQAIQINEKTNDNLSYIHNLNNLGSIHLLQKKYVDAKVEFLKAYELIGKEPINEKNIGFKEKVLDNLSYVLYQLKDYHAYDYQEKATDIRDSLRDAQIIDILAEIEGKFNIDKIQKEEQLKTAQEIAKRKHAQDINVILILITSIIILGGYILYRFLKLRQENLQLEIVQNQLLQQHELEKLQSESQEKILNAALDGKESERKMIAETLHHSVSSLLSSASLHIQASKMQMNSTPPEEIEKAHYIINEAAEKIRNLSHSLVSSVLLKFGLQYSVQDMCEKYSNSALSLTCKCDELKRYAPDFELKINSIIDELINNIIKHSKANKAIIELFEKNRFLEINIIDNGKGFDLNLIQEKSGLGLKQIEARINKMKGIFNIKSDSKNGTKVFISVPITFENHIDTLLSN